MNVKPIIFSGPMVLALLDGRKSQTRRALTLACDEPPAFVEDSAIMALDERDRPYRWPRTHAVGDLLWVREAWAYGAAAPEKLAYCAPFFWRREEGGVWYFADNASPPHPIGQRGKLRSPIFMPRWMSRLTLVVTDVRVQRLQEISEADARSEGHPISWDGKPYDPPSREVDSWQGYGRASFSLYWSKLHGPGAWDANPWVAAYSFTAHSMNVDAYLARQTEAA